MAGLAWVWPRSGERWRRPALVGASVAVHALVLGYMAFQTIHDPRRYGEDGPIPDPFPFNRPILVEIEPRPLLRGETARTRPTPRPDSLIDTLRDAGTRLTETAGATGSADAGETDRPSPPAPRFAPGGQPAVAPPADVGAGVWQVRPETLGDRVWRGMRGRPPGCASPELLSRAERVICDDRFGERAAAAPPISGSGDAARDDRFAREGRRALAEYENRRRPLAGGVGVVGPQDGPGSNFGIGVAGAHLDPALRPDSTSNIRTRRDRIRELEED